MLTISPAVRIYLATGTTDLRRSIDGLAALVRERFELDPTSGHLFLFRNRRGDRVKVLVWDAGGFAYFTNGSSVARSPGLLAKLMRGSRCTVAISCSCYRVSISRTLDVGAGTNALREAARDGKHLQPLIV